MNAYVAWVTMKNGSTMSIIVTTASEASKWIEKQIEHGDIEDCGFRRIDDETE